MNAYRAGTAGRRGKVTPYIEFYDQKLWRWVIAEIYRWWCYKSWPFMKHIEKWHKATSFWYADRVRRLNDEDLSEYKLIYIPLSNRQDLREFHLSRKGIKVLAVINPTKEQYLAITRGPAEGEQPHVMIPTQEGAQ